MHILINRNLSKRRALRELRQTFLKNSRNEMVLQKLSDPKKKFETSKKYWQRKMKVFQLAKKFGIFYYPRKWFRLQQKNTKALFFKLPDILTVTTLVHDCRISQMLLPNMLQDSFCLRAFESISTLCTWCYPVGSGAVLPRAIYLTVWHQEYITQEDQKIFLLSCS